MNIRERLTLLIALTFIALVFIGGFAVYQSRESTGQVKGVTMGVVPSALASVELMSQLKDVQITTLDMVAAKDADQIKRIQEVLNGKKVALENALTQQLAQADSDAQRGLIKQAQESLVNYFSAIDDTAKFKLAGQAEMAQANLEATVDQYLREQVSIIETVQVEKRRSKDEAISSLNDSLTRTSTTLMLVTIFAILALTAIGIFLYRQITVPMRDMQKKMTEIATTQDFTHRVPVTRQDEIGRSIEAFNAMIGKIQEGAELIKQKNADIHAMLHNIPQGILTIVNGGSIHPEYSKYLEDILETRDIGGRNVMELLFSNTHCGADTLSQVDATIAACIGEDSMNFEFNSHLLVTEIEKEMPDGRIKILELSWSPMADDAGTVVRLMLCVWDATALRELEFQAKKQKREMAMIGEILAVSQEKFHGFVESSKQFFTENLALLDKVGEGASAAQHADTIALLFRNMHTVKGNARTYGLLHLTNKVHEAEQTYDDLRAVPQTIWDVSHMRGQLVEVATVLAEYEKLNEGKLGRKGPGRRGDAEKYLMVEKSRIDAALIEIDAIDRTNTRAMSMQLDFLRHAMDLLGTEEVSDTLAGILDSLPSLAAELGKEVPLVLIEDHGIVVRRQASDLLKNVFMHLLRNAVDHGIEKPEVRVASGKTGKGSIRISMNLDKHHLLMRIADDGRGLAVDSIKKRAMDAGLIGVDQVLEDSDVAEMVFASGFSTAEQVTEVSGRGVGMDAVRGFITSEGGSIALHFTTEAAGAAFRPFETVITLPAKLAVQSRPVDALAKPHLVLV
ncbi:ATP-binding protein [Rhodoferax saidenbachensis]|uniref:Chemotaxis protein CheA n=1 Tax=Rhodoferax saidenbachensis TaxID=1484693 RepID=A0A1P8K8Z6_9BURK|nr:ATP-binding protein [Rhodoferax saidenbachensis]APW42478.1 chemotaxis protein CheA [Rhodoferax saidenbachensis]